MRLGIILLASTLAACGPSEEERLAAEKKEQADRQSGFHCLSEWDGASRPLKNAMKQRLRDPDSFEHIETRITPRDNDGDHLVTMQYRSRNGFGGMNVGSAIAVIDGDTCDVSEIISPLG